MQKAVIHLLRMSQDTFLQRPQLFEIFEVDFTLDDSLKIWFMDVNYNPKFVAFNNLQKKLYIKLLEDMFEIVHKYLRSRLRRVAQYINDVSFEVEVVKDNGQQILKIPQLYSKKQEFIQILRNKLEKKDVILKNNKFEKIIDENEAGPERYHNLIESSCF